jgi:hypothetical protein
MITDKLDAAVPARPLRTAPASSIHGNGAGGLILGGGNCRGGVPSPPAM